MRRKTCGLTQAAAVRNGCFSTSHIASLSWAATSTKEPLNIPSRGWSFKRVRKRFLDFPTSVALDRHRTSSPPQRNYVNAVTTVYMQNFHNAIKEHCEQGELQQALAIVKQLENQGMTLHTNLLVLLVNCCAFHYKQVTRPNILLVLELVAKNYKYSFKTPDSIQAQQQLPQPQHTQQKQNAIKDLTETDILKMVEKIEQPVSSRHLLVAQHRLYVRLNYLIAAFRILRIMEQSNMQVFDKYTALLGTACASKNVAAVNEVDKELMRKNSKYSRLYPAMLACYLAEGEVSKALEIYMRMQNEGVKPDISLYPSLIAALSNEGLVGEVFALYEDLKNSTREKGFASLLAEDSLVEMYENLLVVYSSAESYEVKPSQLYKEMIKEHVPLRANTYKLLIEAFCKEEKMLNAALDLLAEMTTKGYRPDIYCYTAIVQALAREDRMSEVVDLLQKGEFVPDASFFHELIESLCQRGRVQEGIFLFNLMRQLNDTQKENNKNTNTTSNNGIKPFPATYTTLLLATAVQGDVKATFNLFNQMKKEGAKPKTGMGHVYQILMKACEVAKDADRALATYTEVMRLGKSAMEGSTPLSSPFPLSFLDPLVRTFKAVGREQEVLEFERQEHA